VARLRIPQSLAPTVPLLAALALCLCPAAPAAAASGAPAAGAVAHLADTCPGADLTPTAGNLEAVRAAVLCLIDREREQNGERALTPDVKLQRAAQGHSEEMASQDYFAHVAPDGSTPTQRMRASGYIYSSQIGYEVGENIAWGTLWLATPQAIVNAWMASPGHRANILDAHYRDTGIGVSPHAPAALAEGQAGALYTQDFGTLITATGHVSRDTHQPAGGSSTRGHTPKSAAVRRSGRSAAGTRAGRSETGPAGQPSDGVRGKAGERSGRHRHHRRRHHRRHRRHHHRRRRHRHKHARHARRGSRRR
jgi:uncharacterized protein YkwD